MVNKKFDYSNEMAKGNVPQDENESKEILRHQRLEQRNNALANEFRNLKPEIGRVYNLLCNLVEKSGVLSETMLNLLELLKTSLPISLTDKDRKALQDELHGIADDTIVKIRKERERMENDIRRNNSRISNYSCDILVHGHGNNHIDLILRLYHCRQRILYPQ